MNFKLLLLLMLLLLLAGCKSADTTTQNSAPVQTSSPDSPSVPVNQAPPPPPSVAQEIPPKVDACSLLTSSEIQAVQREPVKETKLSGRLEGGFNLSQCFYTLPTFTKSISLVVAHEGGPGSPTAKAFWRETFYEEEKGKEGGKEKDSMPPKKIAGVGDEAFWVGSKIGGALYVLSGNSYLRISVGGPSDQAAKIEQSKMLARRALARLS